MRISPEPLHPMRTWRELWHAEPLPGDRFIREQATMAAAHWKNAKRSSFHWLNHLFHRDSVR